MDRVEELKKQFILDWMPPFMEEYEPGAFEKDVDNLLQQYADEQSREKYDKGWNDARKHYKANRFNF